MARCASGVRLVSNTMDGGDRVLVFGAGGSVRIVGDAIETIWCCY